MDHQIFEKVAAVIRKTVNRPNIAINADTSSNDVEGWDSLHHIMIIAEIENEYSIKFNFLEVLEMRTVGDICKAVEAIYLKN